ncbi:MAG TPA: PD-(D/E)XK nuclease family protein [Limnochordia bacterium]|nr:PD-(D/E)XK nuclease family protein [Limnochordia bacterium]
MSSLCLVPHPQLAHKWRQSAVLAYSSLLPFSIKELVAQLLKEEGQPYRDSELLEQIALWEAVGEAGDSLVYYGPMADFPGFIEELHRLYFRYESGQISFEHLTAEAQQDLELLYKLYLQKLRGYHVLNQAQQIEQAIRFWPKSRLNQETDHVKLYYLGELTRLERRLIDAVCTGKQVEHAAFSPQDAVIKAVVANAPGTEVERVVEAIVDLLNKGVEPHAIAVVSPDLESYLPIITPMFTQYGLPWLPPMPKLGDTPIGKAAGTLLRLMHSGWAKDDLEQLTAPGWGLPFRLSQTEHKALRIAPPTLLSPEQWQNYLGEHPGWQRVFAVLQPLYAEKRAHPVRLYIDRLQQIFAEFPLVKWPALDHYHWSVLAKSYHGLQQILSDLSLCRQPVGPDAFEQIFNSAIDSYSLPQPRSFLQQVYVGPPAQAVGMGYHTLFLIGVTEASFPKPAQRDWLSKQLLPSGDYELYRQLLRSAAHIQLSYAEQDQTDRINIASQVFPPEFTRITGYRQYIRHGKPIAIGDGVLEDSALMADIAARLKRRQLSVTRLNLYASCPFRFLCSEIYGLEAEDVLVDDITPQTEGALVHEALRLYWQQRRRVPIDQILAEQYQAAGQKLTKRVMSMVLNFVRKDQALVETSGYYPEHLEQSFEGIAVPTRSGTIRLRGVIDRIDVDHDGNYVIYDYKTGANPSIRQIMQAENLQLQVYLLAASSFLPGMPHGIAFYSVKDGRRTGLWLETAHQKLGITKSSGILPQGEWGQLANSFRQVLQDYLEQILSGHFPIAPVDDIVCTYCPYKAICRKE